MTLYLTLHCSTLALATSFCFSLHYLPWLYFTACTWLYITLPWLYFTLLLLYPILLLSTLLCHSSLSLTLHYSNVGLLHSAWLNVAILLPLLCFFYLNLYLNLHWLYYMTLYLTLHCSTLALFLTLIIVIPNYTLPWLYFLFRMVRICIRMLRMLRICIRMFRIPFEWL